MEHFFSSNWSGDLRSDAHQIQIIIGEAYVDHTQIIGVCILPFPLGFGTPADLVMDLSPFHILIIISLTIDSLLFDLKKIQPKILCFDQWSVKINEVGFRI